MFNLPKLNYSLDSLEPYISEQTMNLHYNKHHKTYIDNLNNLILDTKFADMNLEQIILKSYNDEKYTAIFNNAGQVYNHNIFWQSILSDKHKNANSQLLSKIVENFGDYEKFKQEFKQKSMAFFGSGWIWLAERNGKLDIVASKNADNPITVGYKPVLCLDVWEHAYYLDYQNKKADYVDSFLNNFIHLE